MEATAAMAGATPAETPQTMKPAKRHKPTLREQLAAMTAHAAETAHDLANEMAWTKGLRDRSSKLREELSIAQEAASVYRAQANHHQTLAEQRAATIENVRHAAAAFALLAARGNTPSQVLALFRDASNQLGAASQGIVEEFTTAMTSAYAAEVKNVAKNEVQVVNPDATTSAGAAGFDLVGLLESLGAHGINVADLFGSRY